MDTSFFIVIFYPSFIFLQFLFKYFVMSFYLSLSYTLGSHISLNLGNFTVVIYAISYSFTHILSHSFFKLANITLVVHDTWYRFDSGRNSEFLFLFGELIFIFSKDFCPLFIGDPVIDHSLSFSWCVNKELNSDVFRL